MGGGTETLAGRDTWRDDVLSQDELVAGGDYLYSESEVARRKEVFGDADDDVSVARKLPRKRKAPSSKRARGMSSGGGDCVQLLASFAGRVHIDGPIAVWIIADVAVWIIADVLRSWRLCPSQLSFELC